MDEKDKKILYELDKDCRRSNAQIGRCVGLPKNVVNYRINILEKKGYILGYRVLINTALLGKINARLFFRLSNNSNVKKIIKEINQRKKIIFATTQQGYWDFVIVVDCKNISELYSEYKEIIYLYNKDFKEHELSIVNNLYSFKHNYLWGTKDYSYGMIGGHNIEKCDLVDYKIINMLSKNSRINILDISKKVLVTPKTVADKIRRLRKLGIIQEFRVNLNIKKFGMHYFHVFLKLHNITKESEEELLKYLKIHPNVIYITQAINKFDLEFEMVVPSYNQLYEEKEKIKTKFPKLIEDFEPCLLYDVFKQTML